MSDIVFLTEANLLVIVAGCLAAGFMAGLGFASRKDKDIESPYPE